MTFYFDMKNTLVKKYVIQIFFYPLFLPSFRW